MSVVWARPGGVHQGFLEHSRQILETLAFVCQQRGREMEPKEEKEEEEEEEEKGNAACKTLFTISQR